MSTTENHLNPEYLLYFLKLFQLTTNPFTLPGLKTCVKVQKMLKQMFRIILSPVIVFFWLIGWTLYFVGSKSSSSSSRKSQTATVKNPLEIATIINEELLIATDEP